VNVEKMSHTDLEMAIIENDIVDVMTLPENPSTEMLREIVSNWVVEGDETHGSCK
jgi:hypothetical protein